MGGLSITHILIFLVLAVLLLGGKGKVSGLMGEFAQGIKSFKKNMAEDNDASMEASANDKPAGTIQGPAPGAGSTNTHSTTRSHS
jgi:sec-independent protein translocase protein TatA